MVLPRPQRLQRQPGPGTLRTPSHDPASEFRLTALQIQEASEHLMRRCSQLHQKLAELQETKRHSAYREAA
jgi:hypothetical protein